MDAELAEQDFAVDLIRSERAAVQDSKYAAALDDRLVEGLQRSVGLISAMYLKNAGDPAWKDDAGMKEYYEIARKWAPELNADDSSTAQGYNVGMVAAEILRRCGNALTRENVLHHATHLKDLQLPMFVPGVLVHYTPEFRSGWRQAKFARFDGSNWVYFGNVLSSDGAR